MFSESVIIFGATGNVVMVVNGDLPKNAPIMFRVGNKNNIDLVSHDHVVYSETGISDYICERLRRKNEIGLMEMPDSANPPRHLTNVAYQASA